MKYFHIFTICLLIAIVGAPVGAQGYGRAWGSVPFPPQRYRHRQQPSGRISNSGGTPGGDDAYLRQSSQCCDSFFKGNGKKCFDLKECGNHGGGVGGFRFSRDFGWNFNPFSHHSSSSPFGWIDPENHGICTCMGGVLLRRKEVGQLCCSSSGHGQTETNFGDFGPATTNAPQINFEPPKPTPTKPPSPPPSPPKEDDDSIHALEWTPSIKSIVLSHPNRHLLPTASSCGLARARSGISPYIIGGTDAKLGDYPWMVLLGITSPDPSDGTVFACGGTLINSRYVLTAAHCVRAPPLPPGYKVTKVRLGEFDQKQDPDCNGKACAPGVQDLDVEAVIPHADYDLQTHENDIALIRLVKPGTLGNYVTPICLPAHDLVRVMNKRKMLTVAGWGRTRFDKEDGSEVLQEVQVPIVGHGKCEDYFRQQFGRINEGRFCSGGDFARDSCKGDSGGPIMGRVAIQPVGDEKQVTRTVQLGIVSIGREESQCSMAGEGHLTLYTKIANYLPWILDTIKP